MLKVVLDTNIIVSATIDKKSIPNEVLRLWQNGKIKVILSPAIIEEMWHVLFRPNLQKYIKYTDLEIKDLLLELQESAILVNPTVKIKVVKKDPSDDKFIAAATTARADYIVSGDQHLLQLGAYNEIKIVSPKEFMEIFEDV
mgnify:CR=1 FL=1